MSNHELTFKLFYLVTNRSLASEYYNGPRTQTQKQCFPIYSLILALGNPKVDYFSLDVEGSEMDILKTIPWDKVSFFKVM